MTSVVKIISEVTERYLEKIEQYILTDVKDSIQDDKCKSANNESNVFRKGAYGEVVDLDLGGIPCVGKVLHPVFFDCGTDYAGIRSLLEKFFREIEFLSAMKHSNIVKFLGIYCKEGCSLPILVMEKMEYSLCQYLHTNEKGSLPDTKALGILLDVSKGLVYLHEVKKVVHRDLSSNNILLTADFHAKIADLGSARVLDRPGGWAPHSILTIQPGTMDFMPPEALEDPPIYTASVDVFSFGCVVIHLDTHRWPTPTPLRKGENISEINRREKYISEMKSSYLLPIVIQCLGEKSKTRPNSMDVLKMLEAKVVELEQADYTVVFAGITGSGKSTAGNFFLDKKAFECEDGLMFVTEDCSASTATICGKKVKIIDTPGFFDGFKSTDANFKELSRTLTLAKDGIHAVVFVMSYTRFTKACEDAVQQLLLFDGLQPHVFVMLTHTKNNGITEVKTNEYVQQCISNPRCPNGLKKLMKMVNNRVIMVESVDFIEENYREQKCAEFIAMVENIFRSNDNKIYTNIMLKHAALMYEYAKQQQEKEIKVVKEKLESIELEIDQLKEQAGGTTGKKEIEDTITGLKNEKESLESWFEIISVEQYLKELTDNIIQDQIKKYNFKNKSFSDFVKSFAFNLGVATPVTAVTTGISSATGAIVGGGIGAVVGTVAPGAGTMAGVAAGAQVGGVIGGTLGGLGSIVGSAAAMYDDCKQQ